MIRAKYTLAEIIDDQWEDIQISGRFNSYQKRHLYAIKSCRTVALGGHLYLCDSCGKHHKRYNSCRNRNCPTCQRTQAIQWQEARQAELLPTTYFHVVFTLPKVLNELCLSYPRQMYGILFRTAWETLSTIGWNHRYLGAQLGTIMTLHTWGQNLSIHPHVHCIVPGGGIDYRGRWREAKGKGKFLFPVHALSRIFRGKFVATLKK